MNQILEKNQLSESVFQMRVAAPDIARERLPGQFVILQLDTDFGERIPLTIADADAQAGWISLIFQVVGMSTRKLSQMNTGDEIANLVGPLGQPTHIQKYGTVVCVGGGIGVAPMYPIAQAMKKAGNKVIVIIGARSRELVILEDDMKAFADEVIVCTDDGSYGRKDVVTAPLKELCAAKPKPDLVVAIGPPVMMKFCSLAIKPYDVPLLVSLNTIMIDGTGMCGGCRVTVGGETKFVCVDGPEFDGHLVDYDQMMKRLGAFKTAERIADEKCRFHDEAVQKGLKE